ncbi:permease [Escherichia coli]|uniref:permease n=1 Tax=Escherichia coli TaxID=562 RepID=UPI0037DD7D05
MKLVEHYIMRGTRRLVLIIVGFLIFIFASYSAQRYLTEAANGTLALDVRDSDRYIQRTARDGDVLACRYVSVGWTLGRTDIYPLITSSSLSGGALGDG